ncbi:hypothetical protein [Roseiflexus sp.]|uniref:hypothetical protein n=1 Tax=Roseiflexus sp. TaxID=2562120 RepID=UPI00398BBC67
MKQPNVITYQDELLADGSVHRVFSDGRHEWRRRLPDGRIEWRDNQGYAGIDELLGDGIIKRTFNRGQVVYAREQGYGRTLWHRGVVLTVNQTSFDGRISAILMGMGAGFLLGSLVPPPEYLSPDQEEMLRQKAMQQQTGTGGDGGSSGSFSEHGDDHSEQPALVGDNQSFDSSNDLGGEGDFG